MSSVVEKWKRLKDREKPEPSPKPKLDFATVVALSSLPPSEADTLQRNAVTARRLSDHQASHAAARSDNERKRVHACIREEQAKLLLWNDAHRRTRREALLKLWQNRESIHGLWKQSAARWVELERLRDRGTLDPTTLAEFDRLQIERRHLYDLVARLKKVPAELRSLVPPVIGEALKQFEDVGSALGRVPKLAADPAIAAKVAAVTQHVSARHQQLSDAALNSAWDDLVKLGQSE